MMTIKDIEAICLNSKCSKHTLYLDVLSHKSDIELQKKYNLNQEETRGLYIAFNQLNVLEWLQW